MSLCEEVRVKKDRSGRLVRVRVRVGELSLVRVRVRVGELSLDTL